MPHEVTVIVMEVLLQEILHSGLRHDSKQDDVFDSFDVGILASHVNWLSTDIVHDLSGLVLQGYHDYTEQDYK
jgi:hypothetical protein